MSDFKSIGGTVRSRAAHELRDQVLTGRLRPGDRLDLDEIAEEFGISRTPVREALLELSYEGLVAVTPRSGITVIGISPEDAVDNFAVLATLAGKAAEWATSRIDAWQLAELHSLADDVEEPRSGLRQPPVPPGRQPRRRIAPPAHLSPPGGAGGTRSATSTSSPSRSDGAVPSTPRCSSAIERADPTSARTIAEAHVLDAGAALGDWMRANATSKGAHPAA